MIRVLLVTVLLFGYSFSKGNFIDTMKKDDRYFVIHNGIKESKKSGTYSVKVYSDESLKDFLYGAIHKRVGVVKEFYIKDVDFDFEPDLVVKKIVNGEIDYDILSVNSLVLKNFSSDRIFQGVFYFGNSEEEFKCSLNTKYKTTADKRMLKILKKKYDELTSMPYQELFLRVKAKSDKGMLKITAVIEISVK